jgi:glycosyltransferase involved in cell wall biosynthesis
MISATVNGLRNEGHEAYGLIYAKPWAQSNDAKGCEVITEVPKKQRLAREWAKIRTATRSMKYIRDVDVVHWYNAFSAWNSFDLLLAQRLKKRGIVEFLGSDIRNSDILGAVNPYYKSAFARPDYEYTDETAEHSRRTQEAFTKFGVKSVFAYPQLAPFLIPELWKQQFDIRVRISLDEFTFVGVSDRVEKPLIVHMTTAPICKGTPQVEDILDKLSKSENFEYKRLQGMRRTEVMEWIGKSDIFLDNFIIGDGPPVGAIEAMAIGKPVISYTRPELDHVWRRPEVPYINANLDQLPDAISNLLQDARLRQELSVAGRAYVEKVHDARVQARKIMECYQQILPMS